MVWPIYEWQASLGSFTTSTGTIWRLQRMGMESFDSLLHGHLIECLLRCHTLSSNMIPMTTPTYGMTDIRMASVLGVVYYINWDHMKTTTHGNGKFRLTPSWASHRMSTPLSYFYLLVTYIHGGSIKPSAWSSTKRSLVQGSSRPFICIIFYNKIVKFSRRWRGDTIATTVNHISQSHARKFCLHCNIFDTT